MAVAIINPSLQHQQEHGEALRRAGWRISYDPNVKVSRSEAVLVSGPWYAFGRQVGHPRLYMIDRAYWGDPEYVSISRISRDGHKQLPEAKRSARSIPECRPWKTRESSCLILLDYRQELKPGILAEAKSRFGCVRIRKHPSEDRKQVSLDSHLALSDVAIGWKSTALVSAAIQGVPTVAMDPGSAAGPVSAKLVDATMYRGTRKAWLHRLASAQANMQEIADGYISKLFPDLHREPRAAIPRKPGATA